MTTRFDRSFDRPQSVSSFDRSLSAVLGAQGGCSSPGRSGSGHVAPSRRQSRRQDHIGSHVGGHVGSHVGRVTSAGSRRTGSRRNWTAAQAMVRRKSQPTRRAAVPPGDRGGPPLRRSAAGPRLLSRHFAFTSSLLRDHSGRHSILVIHTPTPAIGRAPPVTVRAAAGRVGSFNSGKNK